MIRNLPPVTRALIFALAASFLFSIVAPGLSISTLPLYPRAIVDSLQIWRVLTYPLYYFEPMSGIVGNLMKLLWTGMLIVYFGGELEAIIHSRRFAWGIIGTTLVGGVIFSLLSPDGVLAGPAILTMFMLTGFAYMWPVRQVAIFGIFWIKSWIIAAAVLVLYVIPLQGFNLDTSASNVFGPIFGTIAALVFFHVTYRQYSFGRGLLSKFDRSRKPARRAFDESNPHDVERRIDEILDKISKGGVGSLSRDEKDFLLKHSENK
jgi:hypothetical protein